jgi:Domain of unknown function (DUF4347)/FG-GAP-like repeat
MQTITFDNISSSVDRTIPTTLVVFDDRVQDLDLLYTALLPGSIGFTVEAEADGLVAISQLLATTGAKYLAIVAHGEPGVVHLGKNSIDLAQIQSQSQLLQSWDVTEIALYSCEVAQADIGKDFIYQLSELTGATVAAAATQTGNRALGGSWDLSVTTGAIGAPSLFETSSLEGYPAVLAVSFGAASYSAVGADPQSVMAGDFNSDGKLDLATANSSSNNVSVLLGNGTGGFETATNFGFGGGSFVTAGDFNGDGKAEILWRNTTDGSISIGQYNSPTQTAPAIVGTDPLNWKVAGTADFNGDAKTDILWRNTNGDVALWQMDGKNVVSSLKTSTPTVDSTWKITGTSDFNGDGKADILWRNDSGAVAMWEMNGSTIASSSLTSTPLVDSSWKIAVPIF